MVTASFPFPSQRLDLNGVGLHYVDEGSGPPVVLLHGNPTWSYFYRDLITALRPKHRVIAPDHVGCGRSDKPSLRHYPYSLSRRVEDISKLIDALFPTEKISLVVHDWGGMIGMAWATRNPERVDRIVAMNTAAFRLPKGKRLPWSLKLGRNPIIGPLLIRGLNLFCRGAAKHCVVRKPLSPEVRQQFLAPYDTWANRVAVYRFVRTIPLSSSDDGYDIVEQTEKGLSRLTNHKLMLAWGLKDFVFDGDYLAEWRRWFPNAEVHAITDAGHYLLEDAGEELIPRIESYLVSPKHDEQTKTGFYPEGVTSQSPGLPAQRATLGTPESKNTPNEPGFYPEGVTSQSPGLPAQRATLGPPPTNIVYPEGVTPTEIRR